MKKYLIGHWTAGNYEPNSVDLNSYQLLINGIGKVEHGKEKTASTGGMNSITFNIACCGRMDDKHPITKQQFESMCHIMAVKCMDLDLTPDKCYTHYEIGEMCRDGSITKLLPCNQWLKYNIGKIDFKWLDYDAGITEVGDYMRNKVNWYYNKLKKEENCVKIK